LPPQAGLYACLFGGLVFWLLCSSRHTCISVTSAISLNAEYVFDTVLARLDATREPIRLVICDLSTSPNIDMAGARMFLTLHAEIAKRGIAFGLVEARSAVRDMLRVEGVEKKAGRLDRFTTLADAIEDFQKGAAPKP